MKQLVLGILAHVDAGKTTLSEALLYRTGAIRDLGRVDHKNAHMDTHALERARGITIFSRQARMTLGDTAVTLLDTPGHVDFSAEMERTLQVLDYAVLVISGTDGVQAHTQTLWQLLRRYRVPVFVFVTKMDLPGAERAALMDDLRAHLSGVWTLQIPIRSRSPCAMKRCSSSISTPARCRTRPCARSSAAVSSFRACSARA